MSGAWIGEVMVAFNTIKPGDILWDCHREKMGNTTMTRMGSWQVRIIEVYPEKRAALASWNGNKPELFPEYRLKRLRRTEWKSKARFP